MTPSSVSSGHYRRPDVHPFLDLTAGVHAWGRTRDVQVPGKSDQLMQLIVPNQMALQYLTHINSCLSSPCCIACQSIFEPGGDGSPVLSGKKLTH